MNMGTHENFSRKDDVTVSTERSFGLVMAAVFLIVALWPLIDSEPIRWWAIGVSIAFLFLAMLWPVLLAPLNKLWNRLGLLLYHVVSPVTLGVLFYFTVTPIALLMRLIGKDPLRLRRDPQATSYWIERTPPGPAPDSMRNQF
jgi:predicted membrane metal-binding protein